MLAGTGAREKRVPAAGERCPGGLVHFPVVEEIALVEQEYGRSPGQEGARVGVEPGSGVERLGARAIHHEHEAGGAAQVPLHCVSGERYEQPIFGCNYLSGAAELDGRRVTFNVFFERGGSTAFITVFFRALRLARSGVELESIDEPTARAHAAFARV